MSRTVAPWTLVLVLLAISLAAVGSFAFVWVGNPVADWDIGGDEGDLPMLTSQRLRMEGRLQMPVSLPNGIDPNTPLKDALELLSKEFNITFILDTAAFDEIGVQKVEEQPVQLPKLVNVRKHTVLRLLLGQLQGESHRGTLVAESDYIRITTTLAASRIEGWTADGESPAPVVDVQCDQQPLRVALYQVRDAAGINVVIDPRTAEKVRKPIRISLWKVPADTAVRLLADMGGLRMVAMDNVLYVTTVENARELESIAKERAVGRTRRGTEIEARPVTSIVPAIPQSPKP